MFDKKHGYGKKRPRDRQQKRAAGTNQRPLNMGQRSDARCRKLLSCRERHRRFAQRPISRTELSDLLTEP